MKKKSHMSWSWTIIVTFFVLSIYDFRFGVLGFVCMGMPIYHALRGRGKIHCSHYCPRGSFLGRFLQKISLQKNLPAFMRTKKFKNGLLTAMMLVFSFSMYHTGGDPMKIAFSVFRFMGISFILGIVLGIFFKPRSWCVVCPMGHATALVKDIKTNKDFTSDKGLKPAA